MAATTSLPTEHQRTDKPALRDFRQEVTDRIIDMLEKGVAPWQKPWEPSASSLGMPFNPTTEKGVPGRQRDSPDGHRRFSAATKTRDG